MSTQSEMKPDLKPCPFCGGKGSLQARAGGRWNHIQCDSCLSRSRYTKNGSLECIKIWNTRSSGGQGLVAISKENFESNMLDGDKVDDCGGAMLSAKEVWEYLESFGTPESRAVKWPDKNKRYCSDHLTKTNPMFCGYCASEEIWREAIDACISAYNAGSGAVRRGGNDK